MTGRRKEAEVLCPGTPEELRLAVARAVEQLRRGQAVALPTETVYGLAANALDPDAVARIFELKGRPAHNPIIVHVADLGMARRCVAHWPELADRLAAAFWPGPLTLVLEKAPNIPAIVTAGGRTVGIRWPAHPMMQAVIRECGFPLAAPSANLSNCLSPTTAEHVRRQLGDRIALILDGGAALVGIESTVLDLSGPAPRILRPGVIHEAALLPVIGRLATADERGGPILKSPGQLRRHYSPRARLLVLAWKDPAELAEQASRLGCASSRLHVLAHSQVPVGIGQVSVIPREPQAMARALYAELHRCDEAGAECIIVEAPPELPEWRGVADRLARAAAT